MRAVTVLKLSSLKHSNDMKKTVFRTGKHKATLTVMNNNAYEIYEKGFLLTYFESYRSALVHFLLTFSALPKPSAIREDSTQNEEYAVELSNSIPQDNLIIWDIERWQTTS